MYILKKPRYHIYEQSLKECMCWKSLKKRLTLDLYMSTDPQMLVVIKFNMNKILLVWAMHILRNIIIHFYCSNHKS